MNEPKSLQYDNSTRKIKICYIFNDAEDYGGASRVNYLLLKALNKQKFSATVLFRRGGSLVEELTALGIRCIIWGEVHEPQAPYLKYPFDVLKCLLFFAKEKPDIIHVNRANYWRPAELLAAKLLRIPIILHYQMVGPSPPAVKHATLIVANSEYLASHTEPSHIPKKVVYNIVDLRRFERGKSLRLELGIAQECEIVAFVGQIKESKGVDLFIAAGKSFSERNTKFLIIGECRGSSETGDAYTEKRLKSEIKGYSNIQYLGYRTDVENLYHTADIITLPSRIDEAFGLVNIEAGAVCKPIVSAAVGGIPEVITDGDNGLLFERGDLEGYIACLARLLDDPNLRRQMGLRARAIVEKRFVVSPIRVLEDIYFEVLR